MAVRKTENRIPSGFEAEDFGQAIKSADGKVTLISFNTSPIILNRLQSYVIFVTDSALVTQVDHYEWTIQENAISNLTSTEVGYYEYRPTTTGNIILKVDIVNSSSLVLTTIVLEQEVFVLNEELEALFIQTDEMVPLGGQPETSREIINDLRSYMDELAPRDTDLESSLNRVLFAIAYVEVMNQLSEFRNPSLEKIAFAFDNDNTDLFSEMASTGVGVCQLRPHVLGMYLPQTIGGIDYYIPKKKYPDKEEQRLEFERTLLDEMSKLPVESQIDLFNMLRFPKSNLKMAITILEGLKAEYFAVDDLVAIINDKSKTIDLFDQFKRGPY